MSIAACAELVQRADPDRFAATMAAPVAARSVLFPIYAFNVEIARAPWVTNEPIIAEMRLQWWADALDEIAVGGQVRRHEVVTALADVVAPEDAHLLLRCVEARRRDAHRTPMTDPEDLRQYLRDTGGALMWAVTRALDPGQHWGAAGADAGVEGSGTAGPAARAHAVGTALAWANYLRAVPAFLARGINPLPEMAEAEFAAELDRQLAAFRSHPFAARGPMCRAQKIAELSAWEAEAVLRRARRDPAQVPLGGLESAPISRRGALLLRTLASRF